jgi:hypothetical protein
VAITIFRALALHVIDTHLLNQMASHDVASDIRRPGSLGYGSPAPKQQSPYGAPPQQQGYQGGPPQQQQYGGRGLADIARQLLAPSPSYHNKFGA